MPRAVGGAAGKCTPALDCLLQGRSGEGLGEGGEGGEGGRGRKIRRGGEEVCGTGGKGEGRKGEGREVEGENDGARTMDLISQSYFDFIGHTSQTPPTFDSFIDICMHLQAVLSEVEEEPDCTHDNATVGMVESVI